MGRSRELQSGNIALLFALALPLILAMAGLGVDYARRTEQRQTLAEISDTLAMRGAREFLLASTTPSKVKALVEATAESFYDQAGEFETLVSIGASDNAVSVTLSQAPKKSLLLYRIASTDDLTAKATAVAMGGVNVCVVALEESASGALEGQLTATLDAPRCALLSNSTNTQGIQAGVRSKFSADFICSSGGYGGNSSSYDPTPLTDCPVYPDPLSERVAPTVGLCDFNNAVYGELTPEETAAVFLDSVSQFTQKLTGGSSQSTTQARDYISYTLEPGVYCGGIEINSNADVTLNPGIYIIKDGPLRVSMGAKMSGDNVGFYLTGNDAVFQFGPDSKISLSAPKTGLLAGLLFFEDRNAPKGRDHRILSDDARKLLGTFYLPKGNLVVASLFPVGDQSAYTAIVAQKVKLTGSPKLVLNANYSSTDVPVPEGIGPTGGQVYLRE